MTALTTADHVALAEQVHLQLFRLTATLRRQEYEQFASGELTLTQCAVLYHLRAAGRARLTDLAAQEQVTLPTMARAIRRLQELGMVRRQRDLSDHRNIWVEITAAGLETQRSAVAGLLEMMVDELSPAEIVALEGAVRPLARLAERAAERSAGAEPA